MTKQQRDSTSTRAAWIATLVAVPVAVVTGLLMLRLLSPADPGEPEASSSPSTWPTSPVRVDAPSLSPRATEVCRALVAELPETLRNQPRREVTAGAEQNAAYGDPAVVISCGVAAPQLPSNSTETVWMADGVCWLSETDDTATVLTTVDREVAVALTVPTEQSSPLQWASAVAEYVMDAIPAIPDPPSGCTG